MSVMPESAPDRESSESQASGPPQSAAGAANRSRRRRRLVSICFAIFTFEIGLFLVIFPWMDSWSVNSIQGLLPIIQNVWDDPYFRGAVTGVGLVNIYIAFQEVLRLLRGV